MISGGDHFFACVPWFAQYAYEVHVLPRLPASSLVDLDDECCRSLALVLRDVVRRYDSLWGLPMPYVLAVHQAPVGNHPHYPFHVELHPPLRAPELMKYLAGPEVGGGTMTNESDPDQKAAELRAAWLKRPACDCARSAITCASAWWAHEGATCRRLPGRRRPTPFTPSTGWPTRRSWAGSRSIGAGSGSSPKGSTSRCGRRPPCVDGHRRHHRRDAGPHVRQAIGLVPRRGRASGRPPRRCGRRCHDGIADQPSKVRPTN